MEQPSSSHRLVYERENSYVIMTKDGKIDSKPKSDYFKLKLIDFDDNRIFYIFKEKYNNKHIVKVEETFTDGIFNCYVGNNLEQISDAETIAKTILNEDVNEFVATFQLWKNTHIQQTLIKIMIQEPSILSRIQTKQDGNEYIIDGMFLINDRGNAFYSTQDNWKPICLVASNKYTIKNNNDNTDIRVHIPENSSYEDMNRLTQITMAKIFFLLYPNPNDGVFMSQLPNSHKKHVRHLYKNRKTKHS